MYVKERPKTISYSYCVFIICLIDWREVFRSLIVFSVDVGGCCRREWEIDCSLAPSEHTFPIYIVATTNTLEVILIPALY
jgi:hypothetical protein